MKGWLEMLKKFTLKNFKNFKDEISIDFENTAGYQFSTDCVTDGTICKMLIYGRNATGKTNLGKAILDISESIFSGMHFFGDGVFLNADSTEDAASFSYEFCFDGQRLIYRYSRYSNEELKTEELLIDQKTIFKCSFENNKFEFPNLEYVNAETASIERYVQSLDVEDKDEISESKIPFLRWLISNVAFSNDSILIKLSNYLKRMTMITTGNRLLRYAGRMRENFFELLDHHNRLKDLEDFLNEMGIECKLMLKKLPDGNKELYFLHERLVPFYQTASSGTLILVDLYRRLIQKSLEPSFIYLDEFDAFYHYEMAEKVINFFKRRYPKCQIIMTSHNTNLMTNRFMRPDCLFILSRSGTLTALCNATGRELREGHNLEKMYISGEFDQYE